MGTIQALMSSNFRPCTIQSMAEKLLKSMSIREDYLNIVTLITLALSLPVSTAEFERGFSKYNLIKTKLRARLQPTNVSTLMKMSLDTPNLTDINTFNFLVLLPYGVTQKNDTFALSSAVFFLKIIFNV